MKKPSKSDENGRKNVVKSMVLRAQLAFETDGSSSSMADFTARLEKLPSFGGDERVEEMLKEKVKTATGCEVVGVSVAWDYQKAKGKVGIRRVGRKSAYIGIANLLIAFSFHV